MELILFFLSLEKELDVQIKLAGKAREKFKQIEAQGQAGIPQPGIGITQQKTPSKWDKKVEGGPVEVVNRLKGVFLRIIRNY